MNVYVVLCSGALRRAGGAARGAAGHRAVLRLQPAAGRHRRAQQVLARLRQRRRLQRHLRHGPRRRRHQQRQVNYKLISIDTLFYFIQLL